MEIRRFDNNKMDKRIKMRIQSISETMQPLLKERKSRNIKGSKIPNEKETELKRRGNKKE